MLSIIHPRRRRFTSLAMLAFLPSLCVILLTLPLSFYEGPADGESLRTVLHRVSDLAADIAGLDSDATHATLREFSTRAAALQARLGRALAAAGRDEREAYAMAESRLSSLADLARVDPGQVVPVDRYVVAAGMLARVLRIAAEPR